MKEGRNTMRAFGINIELDGNLSFLEKDTLQIMLPKIPLKIKKKVQGRKTTAVVSIWKNKIMVTLNNRNAIRRVKETSRFGILLEKPGHSIAIFSTRRRGYQIFFQYPYPENYHPPSPI